MDLNNPATAARPLPRGLLEAFGRNVSTATSSSSTKTRVRRRAVLLAARGLLLNPPQLCAPPKFGGLGAHPTSAEFPLWIGKAVGIGFGSDCICSRPCCFSSALPTTQLAARSRRAHYTQTGFIAWPRAQICSPINPLKILNVVYYDI